MSFNDEIKKNIRNSKNKMIGGFAVVLIVLLIGGLVYSQTGNTSGMKFLGFFYLVGIIIMIRGFYGYLKNKRKDRMNYYQNSNKRNYSKPIGISIIIVLVFFGMLGVVQVTKEGTLDERAEARMLEYQNEIREKNGQPNLLYQNELATIAHLSSKNCAEKDLPLNECSHKFVRNFDCSRVGDVSTIRIAEVLAQESGSAPILYQIFPEHVGERIINIWMNSDSGHREILLDPSYTHVGFGVWPSLGGDVVGAGVLCRSQ